MRFLKENYQIIVAVLCVLVQIYPVVFNIYHPELTQLQVFLKFWWLYVPSIVVILLLLGKEK